MSLLRICIYIFTKIQQMIIIQSSNNPIVDVLHPAQKLQVWKTVCTSFNKTLHNTCHSRILKNDVTPVCMSYRVLSLTYRCTPSSHKDRKGSFTTRPTSKVPGYKNVIKRAFYLQHPACWHNTSKAAVACLGGGENQRAWKKPPQACTEQANRVDITKHKCRDIGLPDGMGVLNRQATEGDGSTGTTLSGHCTIASQTLIFWRHAPAPPISETPGNYPSLAFSEALWNYFSSV